MQHDLSTVVATLRQIGQLVQDSEVEACELLEHVRAYSKVNRQGPDYWREAIRGMSNEAIADVSRGLTFAENQLSWLGGSAAGVIWLFRELIQRKVAGEFLDDHSSWILQNTKNPYNPFGTQVTLGARNYSEYLELSAFRSQRIGICLDRDRTQTTLRFVCAAQLERWRQMESGGTRDCKNG